MHLQDSINETRKRLEIITTLHDYITPSCCQGILLTGSLVYGKNALFPLDFK